MLTQEDDVEIHALAARGWSVSAISRHTGLDRKTVRRYLQRPVHAAREHPPSCLARWQQYIQKRFEDDAHLPGSVLYQELVQAGFDRAYPTMIRELRQLELRPVCKVCLHRRGRAATTEIEHPAGQEIQWDWLELPETPWQAPAFVLVGALSHSGKFRGVFCEQMTFGHLADAVHQVLLALGGTTRQWRTDRMATIVVPGTDRLTVDAAQLAKHYAVRIVPCPPYRAQRKGVVERAIGYLTGSWWRTAQVQSLGQAQQDLDRWCVQVADTRPRPGGTTVAAQADTEGLRALPQVAYPALIKVERPVSRLALVAYAANRYSVPPALVGRTVTVTARVGESWLRILSPAGELVAEHRQAPVGAGQTIRDPEHQVLLEQAVLCAFTTEPACKRKTNRPPSPAALAALAAARGIEPQTATVISLADYAQFAQATTEPAEAQR